MPKDAPRPVLSCMQPRVPGSACRWERGAGTDRRAGTLSAASASVACWR